MSDKPRAVIEWIVSQRAYQISIKLPHEEYTMISLWCESYDETDDGIYMYRPAAFTGDNYIGVLWKRHFEIEVRSRRPLDASGDVK